MGLGVPGYALTVPSPYTITDVMMSLNRGPLSASFDRFSAHYREVKNIIHESSIPTRLIDGLLAIGF